MAEPCPGSLPDRLAVQALLQAAPPELADEVILRAGAEEQRARALPARLTLYLTLALWLWPALDYTQVLARLIDGLRQAGHDVAPVTPSQPSISRARDRLGPEPLSALLWRLTPAPDGGPVVLDVTPVKTDASCPSGTARIVTLAGAGGALVDAAWAPGSVTAGDAVARLRYLRDHPGAPVTETSGELLRRVTGRAETKLRSSTADGVAQEIWALLCVRQAMMRHGRREKIEVSPHRVRREQPRTAGDTEPT